MGPPAPAFESLSLTESHLSIEATVPAQPHPPLISSVSSAPSANAAPASRASSATLYGADSEQTPRLSIDKDDDGGPLSNEKKFDLEAGIMGPREPEEGRPRVLAADGSEVLIVDWKGEDDPAFPKNWSKRRRMGATLM